jgi:polyisoprenoid-binding protein YceI
MNMNLSFLAPVLIALLSMIPMQRYEVNSESTLQISGGSSMHDWSCDAVTTGTMVTDESGIPTGVELQVPVDEIECGKGIMNKKLRKALDSGDHPNVTFRLAESKSLSTDTLMASGTVTAAGKTKSIAAKVSVATQTDGKVKYSGSVDLLMTDFEISPPTAMLGAMKTHDEITISFALIMAPTN